LFFIAVAIRHFQPGSLHHALSSGGAHLTP